MVTIIQMSRCMTFAHNIRTYTGKCSISLGMLVQGWVRQSFVRLISTSPQSHMADTNGHGIDVSMKNLSKQREKKLELIKQEFDYLQTVDVMVPECLSTHDMETLLKMGTRSDRLKYIKQLFHNPGDKQENMKMNKEIVGREVDVKKLTHSTTIGVNGASCTTSSDLEELLTNIGPKRTKTSEIRTSPNFKINPTLEIPSNDTTPNYYVDRYKEMEETFLQHKAYLAWKFGNPLIFDLSYKQKDGYKHKLGKELLNCYHRNLKHPEPFHFYFTDIVENSESDLDVKSTFCDSLISFHNKSFKELFPLENLVYLSPYVRETFLNERDQIFVVGGLLDTYDEAMPTLVRAKQLGVRVACLPLGHVTSLNLASLKALPLESVVQILLDMSVTRNRDNVRRYIPMSYFKGMKKRRKGQ